MSVVAGVLLDPVHVGHRIVQFQSAGASDLGPLEVPLAFRAHGVVGAALVVFLLLLGSGPHPYGCDALHDGEGDHHGDGHHDRPWEVERQQDDRNDHQGLVLPVACCEESPGGPEGLGGCLGPVGPHVLRGVRGSGDLQGWLRGHTCGGECETDDD